jgi:DNA-binding ferritin-like protein
MEHFDVKSKSPEKDAMTLDERMGALNEMILKTNERLEAMGKDIIDRLNRLLKDWEVRKAAGDTGAIDEFMKTLDKTEEEVREFEAFRDAQEEGKKMLEGLLEELKEKQEEMKRNLFSVGKEREN